MSAICGIIHFDGKPVKKSDLVEMTDSSPFRGPDGTRFYLDGNMGFAHLAFHVTPESVNERQPLTSDDGRLVLLADVRLDNRRELLGKLQGNASRITPLLQQRREISDDQLLMGAFERWGHACVDHLLGDFVFAVWDRVKQELFMARDSLGGYSLSYFRQGSSLYFASEISALLDLQVLRVEINEIAVAKTLAGMSLEPDETFFESVHHLVPAHCMHFASQGGTRSWRYWDIDPHKRVRYRSETEYTDHFLDLLDKAVACRLRGAGPVGISLSGGHDSTLLAAVASRQLAGVDKPLKSFSYVFDRFIESDERQYIQPVVDQYQLDATFINADKMWTFAGLSSKSIPRDFLWTNAYSQLPEAVAASAQQSGCRLLIDGMFGDALFCEPSLFAADLIREGRLPTLFSLCWRHRDTINWRQELIHYGLRQLIPRRLRQTYRRLNPVDPRQFAPGLTSHWAERLRELRSQATEPASHLDLSPGRRTRYNRMFQPLWAQGYAATRSHRATPANHPTPQTSAITAIAATIKIQNKGRLLPSGKGIRNTLHQLLPYPYVN